MVDEPVNVTAPAARIIGMPARSASWPSSVRMMWPRPDAHGDARFLADTGDGVPQGDAGRPPASASNVQSIDSDLFARSSAASRVYMPFVEHRAFEHEHVGLRRRPAPGCCRDS